MQNVSELLLCDKETQLIQPSEGQNVKKRLHNGRAFVDNKRQNIINYRYF